MKQSNAKTWVETVIGAKKLSNEEMERIYKEVLKWIEENDAHFKRNCKILYDKDNLERIKRFANAPMEYINERIELNKEVSKSYHKLHHSILLAGMTGVVAILLSQSIMEFLKTLQLGYLLFILILILAIGLIVAMKIRLSQIILRWIGLLRAIRDSEIEIYYLSKIKEHREKVKKA